MRNVDNDRLFETYDGIPQYILNMTSEELDVAIAKEKKRVEELNKLEQERVEPRGKNGPLFNTTRR